jgi:predicted O-methyltransferase YrrM
MNFALPFGRYCLRLLPRGRPIPLRHIQWLRLVCYGTDPLFTPYPKLSQTGKLLENRFLSGLLKDVEMGTWSLSPATLNFLEEEIYRFQPSTILEFGSGISTTCLARYMVENHGPGSRKYVLSIEQNSEAVVKTEELLCWAGLKDYVQVFHAPLYMDPELGMSCYTLGPDVLRAIRTAETDFILIDGPSAEDEARYHTLLRIRDSVNPHARFYLDDALRDGEIRIAKLWNELPGVVIHGVHLTEKGLLSGRLTMPEERPSSTAHGPVSHTLL